MGSALSIVLLNPNHREPVLRLEDRVLASVRCSGVCILLIRRYVPESPRWLVTHGRTRRGARRRPGP